MSFAWWIAFAISVAFLPVDCVFFYRNACRGQLNLLNLSSIVLWVWGIAFVATSGFGVLR